MRINQLFEELKKIDLAEREVLDKGQGLDPLLEEFVYDVTSLPEEAKIKRIRQISDYYNEIYSRSGRVDVAYLETRKWAMKIYVQHHIQKRRKELGLKESRLGDSFPDNSFVDIRGIENQLVQDEVVFKGNGLDFSAKEEADEFLGKRGYSVGKMQGDDPIGIKVGEYNIEKWRNLDPDERNFLDGIIYSEDFRFKPVHIYFFTTRKNESLENTEDDFNKILNDNPGANAIKCSKCGEILLNFGGPGVRHWAHTVCSDCRRSLGESKFKVSPRPKIKRRN